MRYDVHETGCRGFFDCARRQTIDSVRSDFSFQQSIHRGDVRCGSAYVLENTSCQLVSVREIHDGKKHALPGQGDNFVPSHNETHAHACTFGTGGLAPSALSPIPIILPLGMTHDIRGPL